MVRDKVFHDMAEGVLGYSGLHLYKYQGWKMSHDGLHLIPPHEGRGLEHLRARARARTTLYEIRIRV